MQTTFQSFTRPLLQIRAEDLPQLNWRDTLELMANELAQLAGLPSAAPLVQSALEREDCEPTYIGRDMALPHARVAGLKQAGVYIAHSVAGVPWHEELAHLVVFIAVPEEAPELYLRLLSRLVRWRLRLPDADLAVPSLPVDEWERQLREI